MFQLALGCRHLGAFAVEIGRTQGCSDCNRSRIGPIATILPSPARRRGRKRC